MAHNKRLCKAPGCVPLYDMDTQYFYTSLPAFLLTQPRAELRPHPPAFFWGVEGSWVGRWGISNGGIKQGQGGLTTLKEKEKKEEEK